MMVISAGENGAKQLQEVSNTDDWRHATLSMSDQRGPAIAILGKEGYR